MCAETELMSCLYNCMLPLTVLQQSCDTTEAPILREGCGLESTPAGQIRSNSARMRCNAVFISVHASHDVEVPAVPGRTARPVFYCMHLAA